MLQEKHQPREGPSAPLSTYASTSEAQVNEEEAAPINKPSVEGVQPNPNPTLEQVLQ